MSFVEFYIEHMFLGSSQAIQSECLVRNGGHQESLTSGLLLKLKLSKSNITLGELGESTTSVCTGMPSKYHVAMYVTPGGGSPVSGQVSPLKSGMTTMSGAGSGISGTPSVRECSFISYRGW